MHPKPKGLLENPQRTVVHVGEITYFSPNTVTTKPRVLFLFSDLLLITKRTGHDKYLLRVWVNLRPGIKIYSMPQSTTFEFRILITIPSSVKSIKQRRVILHGHNKQEKETWVKLLVHQLWLICGAQGTDPSLRFADGRELTEEEKREEEDDNEDAEEYEETEDDLGLSVSRSKSNSNTPKPVKKNRYEESEDELGSSGTRESYSNNNTPRSAKKSSQSQEDEFKKLGLVEVKDDSDSEEEEHLAKKTYVFSHFLIAAFIILERNLISYI